MTRADVLDYAAEPPGQPPRGAMRTLFLIVLLSMFGFGVIIPSLPFYATRFGANEVQVGLIFALYSLFQFIAAPILGAVSDRHGRRPVLIVSQVGGAAGYLILAAVTSVAWSAPHIALWLIYASRVIDGIAGGAVATAQAYVADVTDDAGRAKGMGMLGAAFGIGFAFGPAVGGLLGAVHVALPAYVAAGLSLLAALMTRLHLPETRTHRPSAGFALAPARLRLLAGRPILVQLIAIWFLSMLAYAMMEASVVLFLARADTFRFEQLGVGLVFGLAGVVIVVVQGGLIGRLSRRFGEWTLASLGPALVCVAMLLYVRMGYSPLVGLLVAATLFNATGRSLQGPTLSSLTSKHSSREQQGATFGVYHGMSSLARMVGPLLGNWLYSMHPTWQFALSAALAGSIAVWTASLGASARRAASTAEPAIAPDEA